MPALEVESERRPVEGGRSAVVIRVRGSVDTSTLGRLDETLTEMSGGDRPLVVLDLTELEYINSRGMANLIKHHDAVTGAGGHLLLAALPKKIHATFETMGLDATFVFEPDVERALQDLAVESLVPTFSSQTSFPLGFNCDACFAPLTAERAGKYRCPRCHGPFQVSERGEVLFFPAREARAVEITFPCRAGYVETARAAASSLVKDLELSSIAAELLDRTVDEAVGLFVGKSAEAGARLRMYVGADSREFTVAFVVTDESLLITEDDQEDLTFRTLNGIVDELAVVSLQSGGADAQARQAPGAVAPADADPSARRFTSVTRVPPSA